MNPEDLKIGEYVTVIEGQKYERISGSELLGNTTVITQEDKSYQGNVLKCLAIDFPFAVFKECSWHGALDGSPITLDLRIWKLKRINDNFIFHATNGKFGAESETVKP